MHERPSPYVGLLLLRSMTAAAGPTRPTTAQAWRARARRQIRQRDVDHGRLHVSGVSKPSGCPKTSLESFAPEFRDGMAARAAELGDVGTNDPVYWEKPLGTSEVHVAIAALSPDAERHQAALERARRAHEELPGVELIWRQDCYQLPTGRTSFGFKDGIGQPAVEGSGVNRQIRRERPLKAGEIILGYPDETGELRRCRAPDVLGRNGTYVVFRKLHTRVAAYRQYLGERASSRADAELLGAKMVGRWQSGAPLALSPSEDDPELGADPQRNNDFVYGDDPRGLKCPAGAHARRANPRDALDREGASTFGSIE